MKTFERNSPLTFRTLNVNHRIQSRQSDAHVRWMGGDTTLGCPQNGVHPVEPTYCVAARSRGSFIAVRRLVVEVITPCSLHYIAADGGHISNLARSAEQNCLRQHRIPLADQNVISYGAIPNRGADGNSTIWKFS